jgi:hypothetical protein
LSNFMGLLPPFDEGQQDIESFPRRERLVMGAIRRVGVGMRRKTAGDALHGWYYIARRDDGGGLIFDFRFFDLKNGAVVIGRCRRTPGGATGDATTR